MTYSLCIYKKVNLLFTKTRKRYRKKNDCNIYLSRCRYVESVTYKSICIACFAGRAAHVTSTCALIYISTDGQTVNHIAFFSCLCFSINKHGHILSAMTRKEKTSKILQKNKISLYSVFFSSYDK